MLNGAILIGDQEIQTARRFVCAEAASGNLLPVDFSQAAPAHVADAAALAETAFPVFSETTPEARASFLVACAEAMAGIGDELIVRTMAETGLPRARLEGERGRTVGQLRLFADMLRRGEWMDVAIDPASSPGAPAPHPDLRRRNVAIGPVAVFGAANFPLAFSVLGGDTASALAAGCPVIVKGHPAHAGAGELVARAAVKAVSACGLPSGVFSYLPGEDHTLGAALVADRRIKAVGFTGSRAGGLALCAIAAARRDPIPVYAEMSSVNPVIIAPGALAARPRALAEGFVQSLTLGAGQFCTNPGLVLALDSPALDDFAATASRCLAEKPSAVMLTAAIRDAFEGGVEALKNAPGVTTLARGADPIAPGCARSALFETTAQTFLHNPALAQEVFGASSLLVRCADQGEIDGMLADLEGQLTVTLHIDVEDEPFAVAVLPRLERIAGRILVNDWPTGVAVSHAMVHGGPFPATSDSRTSSVGSLAIERFLRPVCYQNMPDSLLPPALRSANPLGVVRRIEGEVAQPQSARGA